MKKYIFSLLIMTLCLSVSGYGQDNNRDFKLIVTNKRGNPMENLDFAAYIKSNLTNVLNLNIKGVLKFSNVNDGDILGITYGKVFYEIPIENADSIQIYFRNKRSIDRITANNNPVSPSDYTIIKAEDYPDAATVYIAKESQQYADLADYMTQRISGVSVIPIHGGYTVRIGAQTNLNLTLEPMIVVDDVKVTSYNTANQLVNAAEIESVYVEEHKSSLGERLGNGVIYITTKTHR